MFLNQNKRALTEYDGRAKGYCSIGNGKYIVKLGQDEGKEDDSDEVNVMPLSLGAFVLPNQVVKK